MFKVHITVDENGHALYHDQHEFVGIFDNITDIIKKFGDMMHRLSISPVAK